VVEYFQVINAIIQGQLSSVVDVIEDVEAPFVGVLLVSRLAPSELSWKVSVHYLLHQRVASLASLLQYPVEVDLQWEDLSSVSSSREKQSKGS